MTDNTRQTRKFLPPRRVIESAWWFHRTLYRRTGRRFGLSRPKENTYGLAFLTTTGRRSGLERGVMIGYFEDGDDLVTMAMNGWGPAEPAWWLNLQANPNATVTLSKQQPIDVVGRAAVGSEHERLWQRWREIDKGLDDYAARRPGGTAVVILHPVEQTKPDQRR